VATSNSDEWTEDDDGALHPLSSAEHYAILLDSFLIKVALNPRIYQRISIHHKWNLIRKVKIMHLDRHGCRDIQ
jgi:hypothetical protein